jgi:Predicted transmembrane transcriptional regulator (anti-sigma factor)
VITCAEAVRQLWDFLDGNVEESQRELVEEHLAFCRRCCGELEFAEELRGFLASHAENDLPPDVHARLTATLDELSGA